ncbi:MAG: type II secretion system F family protein [Sedimentisphaerales bacterium]|nr:type II secretion system F family protein [Sedimentisphaerales bacterium]
MPTFEYIAIDKKGKQTRGSIGAESAGAARRQLRNRHLHATKLRPVSAALQQKAFDIGKLFSGRRRRMVLEFTRQLATMVEADMQLTESLAVLISQSGNQKFNQTIQNVRDQVLAGEALADTLKQYPKYFDQIYVSMIRVGEATGNLGKSLTLLTDYMSKRQRIEAKIRAALTYPAILVVISILLTIVLMTFVVPKITRIITDSGRELPGVTKALMAVSGAFVNYWFIMLLVLAVGYYLLNRAVSTPKGRVVYDRFKLKIPVIGELLRQSIVARFTSTLAALIRSGMPMAEALQVVADVVGNEVLAQAVRQSRERIMAGADVATPLRDSRVVTPAVAHMISVGERSGELESMLVTIAQGIEETTDISVQRLSAVIEPVIIVIMAGIVGFILMATLLPILQVANIGAG